jgi:hypothetical protein
MVLSLASISGLMAERVQFVVTELGADGSCCTSTPHWPRRSVG